MLTSPHHKTKGRALTARPLRDLGMSKFALFRLCLTVLGIILVTPAALWWIDFKNRRTRRQESVLARPSVTP